MLVSMLSLGVYDLMYWFNRAYSPILKTHVVQIMHFLRPNNETTVPTPHRKQSKTLLTIYERGSKIARNSVFGRQMTIGNSVSNDFLSTFVDSINVFDCRLSGVVPISHIYYLSQQIEF